MGFTAAVIGATTAGLFSATCAAAKDLISKRLSFRIDGTSSTFASFAFALPFYLVAMAALHLAGRSSFEFTGVFVTFVILRALTDTLAEGLKMHAFAHGDISMVATIFSMSPIILLIIAPWVTGEHLSWWGVGAIVLVTAGSLVLVYRPSRSRHVVAFNEGADASALVESPENSASMSFSDDNPYAAPKSASAPLGMVDSNTGRAGAPDASPKKALLLAGAASFFFALNTCFDSLAMKGNRPAPGDFWSPTVGGFAMTLLSAGIVAPFVLARRDRRQSLRTYQGGLWARGFLEVTFMVAKLYAIQFIEGQYVVGLMRLSVVLSIIGGWLFFREEDFRRRLAAGILITTGVILIPWLKAREEPSEPGVIDLPATSPDKVTR